MSGPLDGKTAIDFGSGQAASQATLLLMQAGATVLRFCDKARTSPLSDVQEALWNEPKNQNPIDSRTSEGRDALAKALETADILIHDLTPSAARSLELDGDTLNARFPTLVHVAIGAWPLGHPKEEMPADDLMTLAESGLLDEQIAANRDGPVYLRFPLGSAHAAYLAAIGALARLYARLRTGRGGAVRTSLVQGALVPMMMHWTRAEKPNDSLAIGMPKSSTATLFKGNDGLWMHVMGAPNFSPSVAKAIKAMTPEEHARHVAKYIDEPVKYQGMWDEWGPVEAVLERDKPRDEWLKEFWANDIPAQPVLKMGDLYDDEQAALNGFVVDAETEKFGPVKRPGSPMQFEDKPTPEIPLSPEQRAMRYPLDGMKVLDFGNFLAGPIGAMLLGDLGADVIKLESVKGDQMRPVDWAFYGCQRNKRDIAVQLKDPKSRDVLEKMIQWADVIHHNQRMPAADKLGFGPEDAARINPDAVYCHVSSYGLKGERKDWPGYDQLFQAVSGWEHEGAGDGNRPMWHRFGMLDHLCGLSSVLGTLAATLRREETGKGELVAASLLGACLSSVETMQQADGSLLPYPRLDHDQLGVSQARRLYQCKDGWVAAAPENFALDPTSTQESSIPEDLEQTVLQLDASAAIELLDQYGLKAVQVACNNRISFFDSPENREVGLTTECEHHRFGRFEQIGVFWDMDDMEVRPGAGPPELGEHTLKILEEVGFDADARQSLIEDEVVIQYAK